MAADPAGPTASGPAGFVPEGLVAEVAHGLSGAQVWTLACNLQHGFDLDPTLRREVALLYCLATGELVVTRPDAGSAGAVAAPVVLERVAS